MSTTGKNSCPVPKGKLVIIGGKEDKGNGDGNGKGNQDNTKPLEVLESFVHEISKEDILLEVITTATSTGDESFNEYRQSFEQLGIHRIGHMHHNTRGEVQGDELLQRVNTADAFFFSGGDQLKLTALYGGTPFLTRLKEDTLQTILSLAEPVQALWPCRHP